MKKWMIFILIFYINITFANATISDGKGIIPNISNHNHTVPTFYHFSKMPIEQFAQGIQRQYINGTQMTLTKWMVKKDAVIPLHHHVNEEITWVLQGSIKAFSQGKEFIVKAGDVLDIPPNVPHEFIALENDTIFIDMFAPARQDWIDATTEVKSK